MTCGLASSTNLYSARFPLNANTSASFIHNPVWPAAVICLVALNSSGLTAAKIEASTWLLKAKKSLPLEAAALAEEEAEPADEEAAPDDEKESEENDNISWAIRLTVAVEPTAPDENEEMPPEENEVPTPADNDVEKDWAPFDAPYEKLWYSISFIDKISKMILFLLIFFLIFKINKIVLFIPLKTISN